MFGREGGDGLPDTRVSDRRPGGGANSAPEFVFGGETAEVGRGRGGGGQSRTVEAGENMSLEDVGGEGGDVAGGGGGRRRRHDFDFRFSIFGVVVEVLG